MLHERIRRARTLKGMSLQQLADAMGDITKQALSKFEQGKDVPNSTRLLQLSDAMGISAEFFFRRDSVELGEVDFRKHSAFGKKQQDAVKEQVREHLERYLVAEQLFASEAPIHDFAYCRKSYQVNDIEDIEPAAEQLREEWELGLNPISNLTEALEERGIKVVGLAAHEKFDGLCALVNGGGDAVIVSNLERPGERQRFNLAHELGHLVLEIPNEVHGTRDEENWCHRFAGAFLFPAKQVKEVFGQNRKHVLLEEFLLAKQEWGISIQAILRRLYDLGIVGPSFYRQTAKRWSIKGFRRNEPGPLSSESSCRLRQLVYRALAEELITPSRAAELLDTSLSEIEVIMRNSRDGEGVDGR
ncbi:XRE family transcriptional regulator [Halomonas sp. 25-S5]|uniref:XRE family transcriptional regulator n=1 Tax=Halomonas sp. 25-S5 TaxID=2994065 RepID=UPI00246902CB|nr:XRE family transcriptional regulator [Halomonas sp. 25-S5]